MIRIRKYSDGDLVIQVPEDLLGDPRVRLGFVLARGFAPEPEEARGIGFEPGEWIPGTTLEELRQVAAELGLKVAAEES